MTDDAQRVAALQSLLSDVIHSLEMTQYDIDDATLSHEVVVKADNYFQQMLNIIHSND
jgi:uncharacterized circularly permuted ATP-grasp superfamily protein